MEIRALSFFKRNSRKEAEGRKGGHPDLKPDAIKAQVESIESKLFVNSSCLCCPFRNQSVEPRLCFNRTYNCFNPDKNGFMKVYGSDGGQVYWKKITDDVRAYIDVTEASQPPGVIRKAALLSWSRILKKAEQELRLAKSPE